MLLIVGDYNARMGSGEVARCDHCITLGIVLP